jgi:hypothetical protein
MQTFVNRIVPAAIVLATLLMGGCLQSKSPRAAGKSAFFNSCSDLDALVSRTAAGADIAVKVKGPWSSSGGSRRRLHHVSGLLCTVRGNPEAIEKLMRSLKAEVEKLAGQTGADIIDTVEGTGPPKIQKQDNAPTEITDTVHLVGFEINYGIDNAHGKFEANLKPVSAEPDKPDVNGYELRVQIEEWAG